MAVQKLQVRQTVRYYWGHVRRFPALYVPALLILPVNVLTNNYLPPLVLAVILNRLSKHEYVPHHVWSSFSGDLILYFCLSLIGNAVLWRTFDMFYWRLEGKVNRSIAQQVFHHLMLQSGDFHANEFGGSLVSSANKLTSSYARLADTFLFQVAPLLVGLTFVSAVMLPRSALYTSLLVLFSSVYIVLSFFVSRTVRKRGTELAAAESRQTGRLADAITNVMAVKSFANGTAEDRLFADSTDQSYSRLIRMMYAFQKQQIFLGSITGLMAGFALAVAIVSVVVFGASIATAFLIFNYTSTIASQLFTFSNNALRNFNRAFGDAQDMIAILQQQPGVIDPSEPEAPRINNGEIRFNDVTFSHDGADDAIFEHFALRIKPGEKIGLVGHSGSGKTTFTRLLLRFSDVDAGTITIDDQDIAAITQDDLRQQISYVPQEPLLFHRSIRENIAYGNPDASLQEIQNVARLAHADEFIRTLPQGYDTLVGERGVKLSGGQRQRIAIARAMIKPAPILVLDEATSALDSESERLIQDSLKELMRGRTAIVIAHRLSTIQKMDRIIVLDNGRIAEQGSHQQLIAKGGTYAKLWAHQSGGFIDE